MTSSRNETPPLLTHLLEHMSVLHERVVLLTVLVEDVPRVVSSDRVKLEEIAPGYYRAAFHYGFMQSPNVAVALRFCRHVGLDVEPGRATFFLGHEEVIASRRGSALGIVRARLFAFLWRNSTRATAFYNIPSERVVAIGLQVIM